jgi:hypothetical protein
VPTQLRPYPSLSFILRRVRPRLLPTHPLNGGVPSAQKRNALTTSGRILTLHSSRHIVYYVLRVTSGSGSVLIPRIAPSLGMLTARVACQKRCERIPNPSRHFASHLFPVTTRMVVPSKREIHCSPRTPMFASLMQNAYCAIPATVGSRSALKTTCRPSKSGYTTGPPVKRVPVNLPHLNRKLHHLSELLNLTFYFTF